jgi:hypothetical protein
MPILNIFFPLLRQHVPAIRPWDVVICKQASADVMQSCKNIALRCEPQHTLISDLTRPTQALWEDIAHFRRQHIQRGERFAPQVDMNAISFEALYGIMLKFYQYRQVTPPTADYLQALLPFSDVWSISSGDVIICMDIIIKDHPSRARLLYGCHNVDAEITNNKRGCANAFLSWKELQYYQRMHYQLYDWGGIFTDPHSPYYGITQYKSSFGGTPAQEWNMVLAGSFWRRCWPVLRSLHFK